MIFWNFSSIFCIHGGCKWVHESSESITVFSFDPFSAKNVSLDLPILHHADAFDFHAPPIIQRIHEFGQCSLHAFQTLVDTETNKLAHIFVNGILSHVGDED